MVDTSFFDESREQSRIKSRIVAKYFWAWAKVIISTVKVREKRIAYMDLFAGPGLYNDGTPSTPVIVLQTAIKDTDLREMLVTLFNDKVAASVQSLRDAINAIPGIEKLKYKPRVENEEVGQKIVEAFQQIRFIPALLFVDPWGYKGLSLALINSVLQNWGSDCVFFFNYNRINPGLNNDVVREHMAPRFIARQLSPGGNSKGKRKKVKGSERSAQAFLPVPPRAPGRWPRLDFAAHGAKLVIRPRQKAKG